jgi:hypothetical protein
MLAWLAAQWFRLACARPEPSNRVSYSKHFLLSEEKSFWCGCGGK